MATPLPEKKAASRPLKAQLGVYAADNYKARLTKGLLEVGFGEGYIVEILNYRTKRVLRRELFDDAGEAKDELARVRDDIDVLSTEEFQTKYLRPTA